MFNINQYLEEIACPSCKSSDFNILRKANYQGIKDLEGLLQIYKSSADELMLDQLVCCTSCNLTYLNPRIKSEIILQSYSDNTDEKHASQDVMRYKTFKRSLKKILAKIDNPETKNKKFLDIGSASGVFLKAAKDMGFEETGFEPSSWMVEFGKKNYNVNIQKGLIENVQNLKYDYISFWDVLEHVTDLEGTLQKVNELSKLNTCLIINVPDIDSYACKIMKYKWPFYLNVHLYYFRKKTLETSLQKFNFKLVQNFPHWQYLHLGYLLDRASKYFSFFSLIKSVCNYLKISKISIPYNMGQTTFVFKKMTNDK